MQNLLVEDLHFLITCRRDVSFLKKMFLSFQNILNDNPSGDENITKPHVIGNLFCLCTHFHDIRTSGDMTFFWYTKKLHEKCKKGLILTKCPTYCFRISERSETVPRLVSTEALATPISSESVLILHHALVQLTTSFHATKRSPKSYKQDNLPQLGNCAFLRKESREKYQE
jgi:hypothetical protein